MPSWRPRIRDANLTKILYPNSNNNMVTCPKNPMTDRTPGTQLTGQEIPSSYVGISPYINTPPISWTHARHTLTCPHPEEMPIHWTAVPCSRVSTGQTLLAPSVVKPGPKHDDLLPELYNLRSNHRSTFRQAVRSLKWLILHKGYHRLL